MDILYKSAFTLAEEIRSQSLSSRDVLEFFLTRIEQHNPDLNAVVAFDVDRARARVRSSSRSREPGIPSATSAEWAAILYAMQPCFTSSFLGNPRCSLGVT